MAEIEASWNSEQLKEFAKKPESEAVSSVYFGYVMNFRNEILGNSKDSSLIRYFNEQEIYSLEDISGLVFTSLHRKLNGKPIDMAEQLKPLHKYWKELEDCERRNRVRAAQYYRSYNTGDTIKVRMPIRYNSTAVQFECPDESDWVYDDDKDMLIKGIVVEKKNNDKDSLETMFMLKVLSLNHDNVEVLGKDVKVGNEIEVSLIHDIFESID